MKSKEDSSQFKKIKEGIYYLQTQNQQCFYTRCKLYQSFPGFNKKIILILHRKIQFPHMYISYVVDSEKSKTYSILDYEKYLKYKGSNQIQLDQNNISYKIQQKEKLLSIYFFQALSRQQWKFQFKELIFLNNCYDLLIQKDHEMAEQRKRNKLKKQEEKEMLIIAMKDKKRTKKNMKFKIYQKQVEYQIYFHDKKHENNGNKLIQQTALTRKTSNSFHHHTQKYQYGLNREYIEQKPFNFLAEKQKQEIMLLLETTMSSLIKMICEQTFVNLEDQSTFIDSKLKSLIIKIVQLFQQNIKQSQQTIKKLQQKIGQLNIVNERLEYKQKLLVDDNQVLSLKNLNLQKEINKITANLQTIQRDTRESLNQSSKIIQEQKQKILIHQISIINLQKIIEQYQIQSQKNKEYIHNLEIDIRQNTDRNYNLQAKLIKLCKKNQEQILKAIQNERKYLQQKYSLIISQIKSESSHYITQINKIKTMQQETINKSLFKGQLLQNYTSYKQFILESVSEYTKKKPHNTKLLFKYDRINKSNFHLYVDNHPNIVLVMKTSSGYFLAGFSQSAFHPTVQASEGGILMSLNNKKYFKLNPNKRSVSYDDYYLIFGNSELRLKSLELKVFSNFAISNSFYNNQNHKVQILLGESSLRQVQLEGYEIHQIIFTP